MKSSIFATAALVAAAAADSVGSAIVVNKCTYDVQLSNVPSADGGYSEVDKTLSENESYTQQWTQLSNGNGWSIKLSNSTSLDNILQYEYTFQDDGTIWYDLSEVNGNPWNGDWEITADSSACVPKQSAYRYATDDAYGMQSCPQASTITVTLCSGESQNDDSASSASASVASQTSASASSTASSTPASSTPASSTPASSTSSSSTPASTTTSASSTEAPSTTLATSVLTTSSADSGSDVVVTVTNVATTTTWTHQWGGRGKRVHQHEHAARHPHARN